jgi:hypothetical protein
MDWSYKKNALKKIPRLLERTRTRWINHTQNMKMRQQIEKEMLWEIKRGDGRLVNQATQNKKVLQEQKDDQYKQVKTIYHPSVF